MGLPRVGSRSRYPPLSPEQRRERPGAFSPGGRLLQVEYARECPSSGPLALAMRVRGGILLAKARSPRMELGHRVPVVWPITRTLAYVANGNLGDMFYLRDVIEDSGALSTAATARAIRDLLHDHAVRTDVRPLALQILLGSVGGRRPSITGFDVTGAQWECDAWAIGRGNIKARDRLISGWRPSLSPSEARDLTLRIFGKTPHEAHLLRAR